MKNAIITGATSSIGVQLIKALLKDDFKVVAVVRPNSKNSSRLPLDDKVKVVELDMDEIQLLVNNVEKTGYDVFYHLAWEGVRVPYRDDVDLQLANYNNTVKAFEVANELNCKVFIGAGSQAEYGRCIGKITEESEANPFSEYGKQKLHAYTTLSEVASKLDIRFKWVRIFSAYGIYDYENTLIMSTIKKMLNDEDVELTECSQNWDYISLAEVANILHLLATKECEDGVYNIASGQSKMLKEFVYDMKEISNSKSELKFGAIKYGSEGVVSFEPVVDKLTKNLNWKNELSFEKGIAELIDFIKQDGNK